MRQPTPDDRVRLTRPIPILYLECGSVGLVRSLWHLSPIWCEVEFQRAGDPCPLRALVQPDELEVIETAQQRNR